MPGCDPSPGQPAWLDLSEVAETALLYAARERGISALELGMRILETVASEGLIGAVLDDGDDL